MTRHPYEFLVRWDGDGRIQGAHIVWRAVMHDAENRVVGETLLAPEPVGQGMQEGFPLAEILSRMQQDLLSTLEAERAARAG